MSTNATEAPKLCGILGCPNATTGARIGIAFTPPPGTMLASDIMETDVDICDEHAARIHGPIRPGMYSVG
jgi:hypothetical protein